MTTYEAAAAAATPRSSATELQLTTIIVHSFIQSTDVDDLLCSSANIVGTEGVNDGCDRRVTVVNCQLLITDGSQQTWCVVMPVITL